MLLFSTKLKTNNSLSADAFIQLVIKWNQSSTYEENKVQGISWHGERTARYGDEKRWIELAEYPSKGIVAARHEKAASNGMIWDTDFILNTAENVLSIQLDRTYNEEAPVVDAAFSTPHFISLLIEKEYLDTDFYLPVLRTPVSVTDKDIPVFTWPDTGEMNYRLPLIYIAKTSDNKVPLDVSWLASRLKGAAHILVEENPEKCSELRALLQIGDESCGSVRIYYPAKSLPIKKYRFRSMDTGDPRRLENVIRNVIQFWLTQHTDPLYTWQGVMNGILNDELSSQVSGRIEAEKARKRAESEVDSLYDTFDEDLARLQEKVLELTRANEALQYENQGLRSKLLSSEAVPLIYYGDEEEYYPGEIRDMILGALDNSANAAEGATRRADILDDILANNPYEHLSDERKQLIKSLFKGYRTLTGAMRLELQRLGFEIKEDGKHYKLVYHGDQRYMVTISKTAGDSRTGNNTAALMNKLMM